MRVKAAAPRRAESGSVYGLIIEETPLLVKNRPGLSLRRAHARINIYPAANAASSGGNGMQKKVVIALDQGTTSSRAVLFDHSLRPLASAQKEFGQIYPEPGFVEHDPMEIFATQSGVMTEAMAMAGVSAPEVAAIGITNQRETTILWERETGKPVYNAIVWQCRRTAGLCEQLVRDGWSDIIREATGLLPDAYFSATKIKWILDRIPGAREKARRGEILFGTVDSWLVWKLTGGRVHITDVTNASRTMLFNIRTLDWDQRLLDALDIPRAMLPEVRSSSEVYTHIALDKTEVPIAGIAGDQQAALFGQGCFHPGEAKNTYGTGCFLLMNAGRAIPRSQNGLLTTVAAEAGGEVQYALEGSIFVGGAVIQWLRDELRLIGSAAESETLAGSVPDSGGVYIVPAFTGLGAPHWDMYARGAIFGLSRGTGRGHLARAALEAIAYQTRDVLAAMEADTGIRLACLKADGGASRNNLLMQFQADIIGAKVLRPAVTETTAMGAAALAGLAVGFWKDRVELSRLLSVDRVFAPQMDGGTRKALLSGWSDAVSRTLTHSRAQTVEAV